MYQTPVFRCQEHALATGFFQQRKVLAVAREARVLLNKTVNLHAQKFRDAFRLIAAQTHIPRQPAAVAARFACKIAAAHAAFFTGFGSVSVNSVLHTAMVAEMEKSTP